MEATELRILNYVNTPYEKEVEIKSIVEDDNWGGYYIVTNNNKTSITVVKPIPLTEQWLLDFGFIKIDKDFYNLGEFKILHHINENFKWTLIYKGITLINNIKHVHRLQNLYFALNDNELIRKL